MTGTGGQPSFIAGSSKDFLLTSESAPMVGVQKEAKHLVGFDPFSDFHEMHSKAVQGSTNGIKSLRPERLPMRREKSNSDPNNPFRAVLSQTKDHPLSGPPPPIEINLTHSEAREFLGERSKYDPKNPFEAVLSRNINHPLSAQSPLIGMKLPIPVASPMSRQRSNSDPNNPFKDLLFQRKDEICKNSASSSRRHRRIKSAPSTNFKFLSTMLDSEAGLPKDKPSKCTPLSTVSECATQKYFSSMRGATINAKIGSESSIVKTETRQKVEPPRSTPLNLEEEGSNADHKNPYDTISIGDTRHVSCKSKGIGHSHRRIRSAPSSNFNFLNDISKTEVAIHQTEQERRTSLLTVLESKSEKAHASASRAIINTMAGSEDVLVKSETAPMLGIQRKPKSMIGFDPLLEINGEHLGVQQTLPPLPNKLQPVELQSTRTEATKTSWEKTNSDPNKPLTMKSPGNKNHDSRNKDTKARRRHRRIKSAPSSNFNFLEGLVKSKATTPQSEHQTCSVEKIPPSPLLDDMHQLAMTLHSDILLPSLAKPNPTSFLTGREVIISPEPSLFQLEIPKLEEFIVHSRVCHFLDGYKKHDMNIDLQDSLAGVPRLQLNTFLSLGITPKSSPQLLDKHKPIVKSLLDCANDIELVRYFEQLGLPTLSDDRSEVAILQRQHQFIVVFQGSTSQQQGFIKNKKSKTQVPLNSTDSSEQVYGSVIDSYTGVETPVFQHLDAIIEENPFCDVIFTGHSFGGAMASLAAVRYATARASMRVTCHVFGSPKVGNDAFRNLANSLPNLKVVRVEYKNDSTCYVPTDGCHIGHAVVIKGPINESKACSKNFTIAAHKFDDGNKRRNRIFVTRSKQPRQAQDYVSVLEDIKICGLAWVTDYKGEDIGEGIRGHENEERVMA